MRRKVAPPDGVETPHIVYPFSPFSPPRRSAPPRRSHAPLVRGSILPATIAEAAKNETEVEKRARSKASPSPGKDRLSLVLQGHATTVSYELGFCALREMDDKSVLDNVELLVAAAPRASLFEWSEVLGPQLHRWKPLFSMWKEVLNHQLGGKGGRPHCPSPALIAELFQRQVLDVAAQSTALKLPFGAFQLWRNIPQVLFTAAAVYVVLRVVLGLFGRRFAAIAQKCFFHLLLFVYADTPEWLAVLERPFHDLQRDVDLESLDFVTPTYASCCRERLCYLSVLRQFSAARGVFIQQHGVFKSCVHRSQLRQLQNCFVVWKEHVRLMQRVRRCHRDRILEKRSSKQLHEALRNWKSYATVIKRRNFAVPVVEKVSTQHMLASLKVHHSLHLRQVGTLEKDINVLLTQKHGCEFATTALQCAENDLRQTTLWAIGALYPCLPGVLASQQKVTLSDILPLPVERKCFDRELLDAAWQNPLGQLASWLEKSARLLPMDTLLQALDELWLRSKALTLPMLQRIRHLFPLLQLFVAAAYPLDSPSEIEGLDFSDRTKLTASPLCSRSRLRDLSLRSVEVGGKKRELMEMFEAVFSYASQNRPSLLDGAASAREESTAALLQDTPLVARALQRRTTLLQDHTSDFLSPTASRYRDWRMVKHIIDLFEGASRSRSAAEYVAFCMRLPWLHNSVKPNLDFFPVSWVAFLLQRNNQLPKIFESFVRSSLFPLITPMRFDHRVECDVSDLGPSELNALFRRRVETQCLDGTMASRLYAFEAHDAVCRSLLEPIEASDDMLVRTFTYLCESSRFAPAEGIVSDVLLEKFAVLCRTEFLHLRGLRRGKLIASIDELRSVISSLLTRSEYSINEFCHRLIFTLDGTDYFRIKAVSTEVCDAFKSHFVDVLAVFSMYCKKCELSPNENAVPASVPLEHTLVIAHEEWIELSSLLFDGFYDAASAEMIFLETYHRFSDSLSSQTLSRSPSNFPTPSGLTVEAFCAAMAAVTEMKVPSPFIPLEKRIGPFIDDVLLPLVGGRRVARKSHSTMLVSETRKVGATFADMDRRLTIGRRR